MPIDYYLFERDVQRDDIAITATGQIIRDYLTLSLFEAARPHYAAASIATDDKTLLRIANFMNIHQSGSNFLEVVLSIKKSCIIHTDVLCNILSINYACGELDLNCGNDMK